MTPLRLFLLLLSLGILVPVVAVGCGDDGAGDDDDDDVAGDDDDDMAGDDDDDDMTDAGPAPECPFDAEADECRLLEEGCEAGDACYWLIEIEPCDPENDTCAEGESCAFSDVFGQNICTDGSAVEPAGRCETPRSNGAQGDACGLGLYEPGDGRLATSFLDCRDGLTCDGPTRQCTSYCCSDGDCSGDQFCFLNQGRGAGVCRSCQGCEVAPNGGCNDDDGCYLVNGCATCLTAPAEPVPEGGLCNFADDCAPGQVCTAFGDMDRTCQRLCRADSGLCDEGDMCQVGVFREDPQLGVCMPAGG